MGRLKNDCAIYLIFGSRVRVPVNPEEIEITYPTSHKTYDVIGLGEIVVPRKPDLRTVSWESFFPADSNDPYVNGGAKTPSTLVECLERAMKEKIVGRLIISRSELYDTNMRCIITDFTTTDKGGEPRDIYYSIGLKEYRNYSPETVTILETGVESTAKGAQGVAEATREIETPVLRVGASVIANGKYWYDSYGSKPFGTANNLSTTVTRIVEGHTYPIHIGSYGWLTADQLQITG